MAAPTTDQLNAQEASNVQQVQNLTGQQSADYQAMLDRQTSQANDLYGQYTNLVNSQTPLTDVYNNLLQSTGVNDAQTAMQGYKDQTYRVQGLLNNLVPDINTRTSGSLTNQAMRDRMATVEGNGLNTQIQSLTQAEQPYADIISSGNQTIGTELPLVEQDYEREASPLTLQINNLTNQFASQLSGFTTEQSNTLNALMDQLDKGMSLSEDEWNQAQTAASQASAYNQYLGALSSSSNAAPAGSTSTVTPAQQGEYNWVQNLISQVNNGNGTLFASTLNDARNGSATSKTLLQEFYALQGKQAPAAIAQVIG